MEYNENEYDNNKNEEGNDINTICFSTKILKTINKAKKIYQKNNNKENENEKKIIGKKRKI